VSGLASIRSQVIATCYGEHRLPRAGDPRDGQNTALPIVARCPPVLRLDGGVAFQRRGCRLPPEQRVSVDPIVNWTKTVCGVAPAVHPIAERSG
jgi:hypothetical protein